MTAVVADTQAILWYLLEPGRLSGAADQALTAADQPKAGIWVSAVTVVEVTYLVEKSKLPPAAGHALIASLADPAEALRLAPVDLAVAQAVTQIPRSIVPDMPDRIIAASALAHRLPLVTSDAKIRASQVRTIW